MSMGTRKRMATAGRKHESVDSNEVARLKEELGESKKLLDEAHACMSQSQADGDGGSVTFTGGAEDTGTHLTSSQVSVVVPASQTFLVEPFEQLGSLSQLSELNADDAANLLHVFDWGNAYEKHRASLQGMLDSTESVSSTPQETASSDQAAHQLNAAHPILPQESSTNKAEAEKPVNPHCFVRVGLAVILKSRDHPGCILTGTLRGYGAGMLALPGGYMEIGESLDHCAARTVLATIPKGCEPRQGESDKCKCVGLKWESWTEIKRLAKSDDPATREHLFPPLQTMIETSLYDPFPAAVQ